jgi:hypothetical protein
MMVYLNSMGRLLRQEFPVYEALHRLGRSRRYALLNLVVLGLAYATASLFFGLESLVLATGEPLHWSTILAVEIGGVATVFLLHFGAALLTWVFSRGLGPSASFVLVYRHLGLASLTLWPAALGLAARQAGSGHLGWQLLVGAFSTLALLTVYTALKAATGFSVPKTLAALALALVYIGGVLYLWL